MPQTMRLSSFLTPLGPLAVAVAAGAVVGPVHAERADRSKPMVVESDGQQAATVDLTRRISVLTGNVVVTQGTLQLKADRVEVREEQPGRFQAHASSQAGRQASFRQKRDRVDEYMEAQADRIEYDGGAERVKLIGNAQMRILRGGTVGDQAQAAVVIYEQRTDTITFDGGAAATPGGTPGRARLVFVPREVAASEPAPGPAGPSR